MYDADAKMLEKFKFGDHNAKFNWYIWYDTKKCILDLKEINNW